MPNMLQCMLLQALLQTKSTNLCPNNQVHTTPVRPLQALGIWEPYAVKLQTIKTALESSCMLLRIDDIVSGISKKAKSSGAAKTGQEVEDHDNVDSERMLAE